MQIGGLPALPGLVAVAALTMAFGDAGLDDPAGSGSPGDAGVSVGDAGDAGDEGDGGGSDGSDDAPPIEEEEEADFRVPRASGRWVYSASEVTNSVAVIDSETLGIDVIGVGRGPTVVAPLADAGCSTRAPD